MYGAERSAVPAPEVPLEREQPDSGGLRVETVMMDAARTMVAARREPLAESRETGDLGILQQRADSVGRLLESKLKLIRTLPASSAPHTPTRGGHAFWTSLNEAIDAQDLDAQAQHGIDLRGMRFDTFVQAVIVGRPVEFQMVSHAFEWQLPLDRAEAHNGLTASQQVTVHAHDLLRAVVRQAGGSLRTNTLTVYDPEYVSDDVAASHVIENIMTLRRMGIVQGRDVVGRDAYFKLHAQHDTSQLAPLLEALDRSPYGTVMRPRYRNGPGEQSPLVTFMPNPEYMEHAARLTGIPPRNIERAGLPLYLPHYAFDTALLAADSLGKDPRALRLTLEDEEHTQWHQQAAALVWFAGNAGMELSQTVYHRSTSTAAALIQKALIHALLPHVYRFQRNLGRFSNPARYTAREYFNHNYGEGVAKEQELLHETPIIPGMLNEDFHCRTILVNELYRRYKPKQFTTMYDEYCGPGSSLARIMSAYIRDKKDGGSITLVDVSPSSIEFEEQWITGTLSPKDARVAELDQQLIEMTDAKPNYIEYDEHSNVITADQRARGLAKTLLDDFDHLEPNSCDVLTDGYGSCSSERPLVDGEPDPVPPSFEDFCIKQKKKFIALRPGGTAVGMHMVRRTNWNGIDTDTQQPIELASVYLASEDEIVRSYSNAGFVNIFCKIVTVSNPHHTNTAAGQPSTQAGKANAAPANASSVAMAVVIAEKPAASHTPA